MALVEMDREEIEAAKLAVRRLGVHNISSRRTIVKCIQIMLELYNREKNVGYLHAAVARIQAYLELGFCYDDEAELFDQILKLTGTSKMEQFPRRAYAAKRILLTHAQVGGVIKRWHGVRGQTKTKLQVIDDIIDKVNNRLIGTYEYRNAYGTSKKMKDIIYILYVEDDEQLLYDVERDVFYTFENP